MRRQTMSGAGSALTTCAYVALPLPRERSDLPLPLSRARTSLGLLGRSGYRHAKTCCGVRACSIMGLLAPTHLTPCLPPQQDLRSRANEGGLPPGHASRDLNTPNTQVQGANPAPHRHMHQPPSLGSTLTLPGHWFTAHVNQWRN